MGKVEQYRAALASLEGPAAWIEFLRSESRLPGPRSNLELLAAFAQSASVDLAIQLATLTESEAPGNTPGEFLTACGTAALGRLAAQLTAAAAVPLVERLRANASDGRWRVREGVAMALQSLGSSDYGRLVEIAAEWARGNPLEQRAAAASLAEPGLLRTAGQVEFALATLDAITRSIEGLPGALRKSEGFRVLRQGMGYCWSVVAEADFAKSQALLETWLGSQDRDVRWLMVENLRKNRLLRVAPAWVDAQLARLGVHRAGGTKDGS